MVTIALIGLWVCGGWYAGTLFYRSFMNKYGWKERAIDPLGGGVRVLIYVISLAGPLGILVILIAMGKYCFMSKEKALSKYDAEDLEEYGYYIGRKIAQDEGRLPKGFRLKPDSN